MKYTKAVQCDNCGYIELSSFKTPFKIWFKDIGWHQCINGNGTTSEFCSKDCYKSYKGFKFKHDE